MTYTWIYIMLLMFAGSFILQMVPLLFYFEAVIAVNLLILAASWFILGVTGFQTSGLIYFLWQGLR